MIICVNIYNDKIKNQFLPHGRKAQKKAAASETAGGGRRRTELAHTILSGIFTGAMLFSVFLVVGCLLNSRHTGNALHRAGSSDGFLLR